MQALTVDAGTYPQIQMQASARNACRGVPDEMTAAGAVAIAARQPHLSARRWRPQRYLAGTAAAPPEAPAPRRTGSAQPGGLRTTDTVHQEGDYHARVLGLETQTTLEGPGTCRRALISERTGSAHVAWISLGGWGHVARPLPQRSTGTCAQQHTL